MPNVSFQQPNDYSIDAQQIERQRKYAELLQQQSLTPIGDTQMAGGWAIRKSPFEGIAKLAQAGTAAYKMNKADEMQKALAERLRGDRSSDFSTLAQSMQGQQAMPERMPVQDQQEIQQQADQGSPAPPNIPAQPAVPAGQINPAVLGQLRTPEAQNMALKMWQDQMKPTVLGRTLVTPAGKVLATDSTWEAEQKDARAAREYEGAAKREEAASRQANDQKFRDEQARQAALDRAALAKQTSADRAAMRPPPVVQPLVQIMGENGPTWVERKDAIGKVPAGVGSKEELKQAGRTDVDSDVVKLKDMLDRLKTGGGITDTSKGPLANLSASVGSSAVGQMVSGAVGSKNQSARNELLMIRPSLLRSIMSSTGMSAKQMDSNAELKLWLSTATDPTKDYQANVEALNNISKKYGSGALLDEPPKRRATDTAPSKVRTVDW